MKIIFSLAFGHHHCEIDEESAARRQASHVRHLRHEGLEAGSDQRPVRIGEKDSRLLGTVAEAAGRHELLELFARIRQR